MKQYYFKAFLIMFASVALLFSATEARGQFVPMKHKPQKACEKVVRQLGNDKNFKEQDNQTIANTNKTVKTKRMELQRWADGSEMLIAYVDNPKKGFVVFMNNGKALFGKKPVTKAEIMDIDGNVYYYGTDAVNNLHYLCNSKGWEIVYATGPVTILDDGEDKILSTVKNGKTEYRSLTGSYLCSSKSSDMIETTPAATAGIRSYMLDGDTVDIYSPERPKYFYNHPSDESIFAEIHQMDGKLMGMLNLESDMFLVSPETGWVISSNEPDFKVNKITRKFDLNGKETTENVIVNNAYCQSTDFKNSKGEKILSMVEDIAYGTTTHAVYYTKKHKEGAIFLRDTALNIPPRFFKVGYLLDSLTGTWQPWVQIKAFDTSVPYVKGMENNPVEYDNEGEKLVNEGQYSSALRYYSQLPEDHIWTQKELRLINHAAVEYGFRDIAREHFLSTPLSNPDAAKLNEKLKHCIDHLNKEIYKSCHISALKIFDRAKLHPADNNALEAADRYNKNLHKNMEMLDMLAAQIKTENEAHVASYEEAKRLADAAEAERRYKALKRQQQAQRNTNLGSDNPALLMGIFGIINNAISRVAGVRSYGTPHVTYTPSPGAHSSGGAFSGGASSSSHSGGSGVTTAPKCSTCGGSGACNACHGHPGKATSAKNSPTCHGCQGSGRCKYCGGSGYRH